MIMDNFSKWYIKGEFTPFGEVFDIGGTTKMAIHNYHRGEAPDSCGSYLQIIQYYSFKYRK